MRTDIYDIYKPAEQKTPVAWDIVLPHKYLECAAEVKRIYGPGHIAIRIKVAEELAGRKYKRHDQGRMF